MYYWKCFGYGCMAIGVGLMALVWIVGLIVFPVLVVAEFLSLCRIAIFSPMVGLATIGFALLVWVLIVALWLGSYHIQMEQDDDLISELYREKSDLWEKVRSAEHSRNAMAAKLCVAESAGRRPVQSVGNTPLS